MEKVSFADMPCSMANTLDIIGEWWSLLIIRDIFIGINRFNSIRNHLGIARNMLQRRLKRLEDTGIIYKSMLDNGHGEFRLTDAGVALYPILLALANWGDEWLNEEPPNLFIHDTCGKPVNATLVCNHCGEPLAAHNITQEPGPAMQEPEASQLRFLIKQLKASGK
jgi:DNA-binding HxlR family transcriptional regulator|tara:strand:+ start:710 stop:1207 length:498 start_codon:yes stop_codon:yes gene_type:complete